MKILILFLVLCLSLCACKPGTAPETTTVPSVTDPTEIITTEPPTTLGSTGNEEPNYDEPGLLKPEETTSGLTLPEHFEGIVLPEIEFEEDGSISTIPPATSEPVTTTPTVPSEEPDDTTEDPFAPQTDPAIDNGDGPPPVVLPEIEFE